MNLLSKIKSHYISVLMILIISNLIFSTIQLEAQVKEVPLGMKMVNGDLVDTTLKFTASELSRQSYLELYQLNDLTNVTITQYEVSNFPVIRAWVRVTDENGNAVTGLDHSNFSVTENSLVPSFDVDSVGGGQNPISVSLVIDRSGSMQGTAIVDAKNAANEFVDNMSVLDRAAIISFATTVSLDQVMTSDTTLLHNAINAILATGNTYLYDGVYEGIAQCEGETGVKAVIAFTDGNTSTGTHTQQDAIDYANTVGCPIYTIGIGSVVPTPLQELASNTGGDYYYAPTSADIAQVYQDISQSIEQQYIVAFNSPNPLKDGTSRTVVIDVEQNAFNDNDSFTYTAPMDVNDAPVITLTTETQNLINSTQTANVSVTISANITDNVSVSTARLFYRTTNSGIYTQVDMTNSSGDLYEYTISGAEVSDPGMQFYFTASDGDGHSVSSPSLQPYDYPYSFAVDPNEAPQITHNEVVQSQVGKPITISASVTDITNSVSEVKLFYRNHANVLYKDTVMTNSGGDNYTAIIPETYVDTSGVDYFISAWDDYGVRSDYGSSDSPLFIEGIEHPSMYIKVKDSNGYEQLLRFGTADDATNGYDTDYDKYAPPLPPSGAADARFSVDGEDYLYDFRATNSNKIIWTLSYQVSFNGDPVTLTWDNAIFPEGRFLLKDAATVNGDFVNVDMKTQNSYTITNQAITELEIVFTTEVCFTKFAENGWNLVGLPSELVDAYYLSVFPNALNGTLYGFNGTYFNEDTLNLGEGYWLRFPAEDTLQLCGYKVDSLTLDLNEGWNLISGPSANIDLNNIDDPGNIIISSTLFGFNGAYFLSDSVLQGNAYWIRTNAAGQIKLTDPSSGIPKNSISLLSLNEMFKSWIELTVTDASGTEQSLYFAVKDNYSDKEKSYQVPPLPPKEAFDVRFKGGYWASTAQEPLVQIQAENFPLTVKMNFNNVYENSEFEVTEIYSNGSEGLKHHLTAGNGISISNSLVKTIKISKINTIPLTFYVEQNYPNPFNPETEIRYSIADNCKVEIAVYNTLGKKIKTLLMEEQKAGVHSVKWDATNEAGTVQSSGIYFYKISAGSNVAFRKMILMK